MSEEAVRSVLKCRIETPAQIWVQRQAMNLDGSWVDVGGPVMLPADGQTSIHLGRMHYPAERPNVRLIIAEVNE